MEHVYFLLVIHAVLEDVFPILGEYISYINVRGHMTSKKITCY